MLPTKVACCIYLLTILTNVTVSILVNSVEPDETAIRDYFGSMLFDQEASKIFQLMTNAKTFVVIGALRVRWLKQCVMNNCVRKLDMMTCYYLVTVVAAVVVAATKEITFLYTS